jgi:PiT family inorganic phosphate transporter
MHSSQFILTVVIVMALLFDFSNGWHDSANAIATVVSTRVLSPFFAVIMAAVLNFLGAYLSTKVAKTIGSDIVAPQHLSQIAIFSAMLAAFIWSVITVIMGLPVSSSHSLIGGIIGAVIFSQNVSYLNPDGIVKILVSLAVSPLFGFLLGFLLMWLLMWLLKSIPPSKINRIFGKLQILSSGYMALMHGTNDAQKTMGIITMALLNAGMISTFKVPLWVISICALAMALGTSLGGWKVIKTLGVNLLKLQPVHGFAAETSSATVLLVSALFGLPVSTTHAITGSILGVGSTRRLSAVKWGIGKKIVYAWIITFPFTMLVAGGIHFILKLFF